ncbi:MAG TPA: hypothetical protein VFZ59_23260 [Verrucomicrobiae bacterium]|nr:hypothetical protein [Verrucomicrobiae bacterium]
MALLVARPRQSGKSAMAYLFRSNETLLATIDTHPADANGFYIFCNR